MHSQNANTSMIHILDSNELMIHKLDQINDKQELFIARRHLYEFKFSLNFIIINTPVVYQSVIIFKSTLEKKFNLDIFRQLDRHINGWSHTNTTT